MTWTMRVTSIHDCLMVLFTFIRSPSTHMRAPSSIMDKDIMDMAPTKEVEAKMGASLSYGQEEKQGGVDEEEVVLPGFRFHPTDEELIAFYLRRKIAKKTLSIEIIKEIDIYKYSPWDLPKVSTASEKEMYFFCLRGRKYRNSIRPNRVTGSGFWKATGIDRPIYSSTDASECVGLKKSLVYYRGSAGKGTKTEWMMHEFRLPSTTKNNVSSSNSPSTQEAEIWTICRILKRNVTYKKHVQTWKISTNYKQIPADSASNTSSFELDARDEYKCFTIQHGESLSGGFNFGGTNQIYESQWNPAAQAPLLALYPQIQNPVANEFCKEGNWDELGRIMECVIDPAFNYGYSSYP